jgi:integrase
VTAEIEGAGIRMVSFPAAILPELQHHLDTYSLDGPDGWVFVSEHGQPWPRGTLNRAVRWREAREQIGLPNLHFHDLRHTGNTLAAQSGVSRTCPERRGTLRRYRNRVLKLSSSYRNPMVKHEPELHKRRGTPWRARPNCS